MPSYEGQNEIEMNEFLAYGCILGVILSLGVSVISTIAIIRIDATALHELGPRYLDIAIKLTEWKMTLDRILPDVIYDSRAHHLNTGSYRTSKQYARVTLDPYIQTVHTI